jgi:hypothetical protein
MHVIRRCDWSRSGFVGDVGRKTRETLHDLGAAIVEHEQVLVGLDQIDGLAGQEPGDVEAG